MINIVLLGYMVKLTDVYSLLKHWLGSEDWKEINDCMSIGWLIVVEHRIKNISIQCNQSNPAYTGIQTFCRNRQDVRLQSVKQTEILIFGKKIRVGVHNKTDINIITTTV